MPSLLPSLVRGNPSRIAETSDGRSDGMRSEEHTSELQSHHDLVCRLLLEKKKNIVKHPYGLNPHTVKSVLHPFKAPSKLSPATRKRQPAHTTITIHRTTEPLDCFSPHVSA